MKAVNTYNKNDKKDPFKEMYLDATDPIRIEENVRKIGINKHKEDRKKDTGIC